MNPCNALGNNSKDHKNINLLKGKEAAISYTLSFGHTKTIRHKTLILIHKLEKTLLKDARAGRPCASVLRKLSFCL